MKAGKAYITSIGTTGLLVASSVLLLIVVGALIAFDGWPSSDEYGPPESVAIGEADTQRVVAKRRIARALAAAAERRRDGAATSGARGGIGRDDGADTADDDRVISNLPAPDSRPGTGNGDGKGDAGTPGDGGSVPAGGGPSPAPVIGQVGDTVSGVDPQAGSTIGQTGDTVSVTIGEVVVPGVEETLAAPRAVSP